MIQKSYFWAYIQKKWKLQLEKTNAPQCSQQHHLQHSLFFSSIFSFIVWKIISVFYIFHRVLLFTLNLYEYFRHYWHIPNKFTSVVCECNKCKYTRIWLICVSDLNTMTNTAVRDTILVVSKIKQYIFFLWWTQ